MMSFENIHVGADVQVLRQGYLNQGKVRWKGKISGKSGNWVGVELEERVGNHSGIYKGIQYFECTDGYGIFVRASQIRFPPTKGRSRNLYKTVSKASYVDENLFARIDKVDLDCVNKPFKPAYIPQIYASDMKRISQEKLMALNERKYFPLRHVVGKTYRKSMEVNITSFDSKNLFSFDKEKDGTPRSMRDWKTRESQSQLISSPSIPQIHNPVRSVKICW